MIKNAGNILKTVKIFGRNYELKISYKRIKNPKIKIAGKELEVIMEKVRTTLKFAPEDFKIMRLNGRLAKCISNRLIINPEIVKYRKEIIEYVIFYEFCKLKINRTGKKFYDMLKQYMPNYESYAFELVGVQY